MKEIQLNFWIVDGHPVTFSFAQAPNRTVVDRVKQMLLASFPADTLDDGNGRFANPPETAYDTRGEAHAP